MKRNLNGKKMSYAKGGEVVMSLAKGGGIKDKKRKPKKRKVIGAGTVINEGPDKTGSRDKRKNKRDELTPNTGRRYFPNTYEYGGMLDEKQKASNEIIAVGMQKGGKMLSNYKVGGLAAGFAGAADRLTGGSEFSGSSLTDRKAHGAGFGIMGGIEAGLNVAGQNPEESGDVGETIGDRLADSTSMKPGIKEMGFKDPSDVRLNIPTQTAPDFKGGYYGNSPASTGANLPLRLKGGGTAYNQLMNEQAPYEVGGSLLAGFQKGGNMKGYNVGGMRLDQFQNLQADMTRGLDTYGAMRALGKFKSTPVPEAIMQKGIDLKNPSLASEQADIRGQARSQNRLAKENLTSGAARTAAQANVFGQSNKALGSSYAREAQMGMQQDNQEAMQNLGVDTRNIAGLTRRRDMKFQKDLDEIATEQQIYKEVEGDALTSLRDRKADANVQNTALVEALTSDPRTWAALESLPDDKFEPIMGISKAGFARVTPRERQQLIDMYNNKYTRDTKKQSGGRVLETLRRGGYF